MGSPASQNPPEALFSPGKPTRQTLVGVPKSKFNQRLSFILALLCQVPNLLGQVRQIEVLNAANGLSQGMIYDILQDRRGFLWFATHDGLNRYDGYHFEVFQNDPFEPFSISDNIPQALAEDAHGRIWVGTENNGINVFDPATRRFYHLRAGAGGITNPNVVSLEKTPDGAVWVGTTNGANRVWLPEKLPDDTPELLSLARVETFFWDDPNDGNPVSPNLICDMLAAPDGTFWVATPRQLGQFDPKTGGIVTRATPAICGETDGNGRFCLGPDGAVWFGMHQHLLRFRGSGAPLVIDLPVLSGKMGTQPLFDAKGNFVICTQKVIYWAQADAMDGEHIPLSAFKPIFQLPDIDFISGTTIKFDRTGLLWLGTNGYGIRKINLAHSPFQHFMPSISTRWIRFDHAGAAWVWRGGGYFNRLDESKNALGGLLWDSEEFTSLNCLFARDGTTWVLGDKRGSFGYDSRLTKVDPRTRRALTQIKLPIEANLFGHIIEGRDGHFWIIGINGVLLRFDPASSQIKSFDLAAATGHREVTSSLSEDAAGRLWLGTPHGLVRGVLSGNGEAMSFSVFKNNPTDRSTLANNFVLSTLDDPTQPNERLWAGTKGGGLHLLDKNTGQVIRRYTTADGLPNNVIYGILSDASGSLWLSTNSGLSKFDPQKAYFQNFSAADGLQNDEFNSISYARAPDGRLFFGGVSGLTAFRPEDLVPPGETPPVFITGLKIQNRPARPGDGILEKSPEFAGTVTLKHFQNQLTFEFAAMDFSAPHKNQFRYRLIGADDNWVEPTTLNSATYANLAPGKYTFEVVTGGSRGVWNGPPARLEILVLPPWWKSQPAYLLYFLASIWAAWAFYRFQINKIKLQNERDFEHREAQRLAELDRLKTNFFSSVTHEFRTPLTLQIEPVRQLLTEIKEPAQRYRLELVEKSGQRLLRFVNQLLDLSKLEAGQMPLDPRPGELSAALSDWAESFRPMAAQRGVSLETQLPAAPVPVTLDWEKLEQVVSNLLSNALKFTHEGGKVRLELRPSAQGHEAQILVSDTGMGIAPSDLPRVFERFFQTEHTQGGTGIGLALTKELVERMGGTVSVQSQPGAGTTFAVQLPLATESRPLRASARAETTAAKTEKPLAPYTEPARQSSGLQILLIEDDPALRQFIRASLPSVYRIAEAADGAEGIRMALDLVPDLVVSDLMMPEKSGFEVAETLKNDPRTSHVPVILLTAKSAVESKIQGLQRGADAYLTKPFRSDELVAHIENLVAARLRLQAAFSKKAAQQPVRESAAVVFDASEGDFLRQLLDVVEENLDNSDMDAEAFARAVFMSRAQLYRKLTALTGQTLGDFVKNHRLDRAREMLLRHEGSVKEVAARTGFSNAKHFSTVFRERFGVPPSAV